MLSDTGSDLQCERCGHAHGDVNHQPSDAARSLAAAATVAAAASPFVGDASNLQLSVFEAVVVVVIKGEWEHQQHRIFLKPI
jgi:hypothetical protein